MPTVNTALADLDPSSDLTGTETFYSDTGSADVKVTADQIATFVATKPIAATDSTLTVKNAGDSTKVAKFDSSGITTATTRTYTFPDATTTLVGHDATQTLTNKTLTSPTLTSPTITSATIGNSNTITARDDRFTLQDSADTTKQLVHELSGITTATTRTVTWPDANITVTGIAATQTLTNKTIGNSNILTARTDRFTLQDSSDTTKQLTHVLSGITTATTRTATWPDANITVTGIAATQTLTNKTMSGASNTFSAIPVTAIAEYATGTFTPTVTIVGGAGNTVPVYSTNTGRYTRIGNRVLVDILLTGDGGAEGAGTGAVNIAIPFAASASFPLEKFIVGAARNGSAEYILSGEVPSSGASTVQLLYPDTISNLAAFTGAQQDNATRFIRLSFCYEV